MRGKSLVQLGIDIRYLHPGDEIEFKASQMGISGYLIWAKARVDRVPLQPENAALVTVLEVYKVKGINLARGEQRFAQRQYIFPSPELLATLVARMKRQGSIEKEIAGMEGSVEARVAAQAKERVMVKNFCTFYRRGKGWQGPGGYYGPGTILAKMCDAQMAKTKASTSKGKKK